MRHVSTFLFLLLFISSAFSQSWIRQNPFPKLAQLYDVDFDGDYGLAVGTEGTIFTTTNGGTSWIPRTAPASATTIQTAFVVPGTNGQTMLAGGNFLFLSKDGGETWSITFNDLHDIFKIELLPTGEWLALGAGYGVRSDDGGLFWQAFNYPSNNITAGHFTSTMNGWVQYGSFNENQVWVTTNGGFNWSLRDTTKFSIITELIMLDDDHGFLSTNDDVYKTTDGGASWISLDAQPGNSITDLHVVNSAHLWASEINGDVYYSLTGGGEWTEYNPNLINSNSVLGLHANADGKVWMAGKYVSILYSDDYAATWRDQIPNSKATLFAPSFADEFKGIIGGSEGTVFTTTDGGSIWDVQHFSIDDNFFGSAIYDTGDQLHMWLGTSSGRVYYSDIGGSVWDTVAQNLGSITDLININQTSFIATTEQGRIYKGAEIIYDDPGVRMNAIDGFGLIGGPYWAVGDNGKILYSAAAGTDWDLQYADDHTPFADVEFTNQLEGFVIASNFTDTLWFTNDGGESWHTTLLPMKSFWSSVSFMNPDTGWIAGGSAGYGVVLRTNNGGLDWTIDHESPERLMGIDAVYGEETVWAVGFGGNVVKFSLCNELPTIEDLTGISAPCKGDTISYSVTSSEVDLFEWTFPADWLIYGNPNSGSVEVIVGQSAGDIQVKGSDACGNVTDLLSLAVAPVDVPALSISETDGVLTANIGSGFYQWLLNGNPIIGANEQSYTPVESGVYELVLTVFGTGCNVLSNSINVTIIATDDPANHRISICPNPAKDFVIVSMTNNPSAQKEGIISVYQLDGRLLSRTPWTMKGTVDVSNIPSGIYLFSLQTESNLFNSKVMIHH